MPLLGYKHTKEAKRKIGEANKGQIVSEEHKRKLSEFNKGKTLSLETKRKIGEASKGNKYSLGYKNHLGHKHSEEVRKRISEAHKGKRLTEEHKRKLSESNKGNKYSLGYKHTKEAKRKIGEASKGKKYGLGYHHTEEAKRKIGKASWMGGISFEPYGLSWTKQLKESIRERDNNVCQLCNKHQSQLKRRLAIHHIDYIKTNIFTFNLISLCVKCHGLTNNNRNHWTTFFRNYLSEKYGYKYNYQQKILVSEVKND